MDFSPKKQGIYNKIYFLLNISYTMEKDFHQKKLHIINLEVQKTTYIYIYIYIYSIHNLEYGF